MRCFGLVLFFTSFSALAASCKPPTEQEVASTKFTLSDFVALRSVEGDLVATPLTTDELDALAYFYAASDLEHLPFVMRDRFQSWRNPTPAPPNAERDTLWRELEAMREKPSLERARLQRAYLATLGFPGPIRGEEEEVTDEHPSHVASIMHSLSDVDLALGNDAEAEVLYLRAPVGGCGMTNAIVFAHRVERLLAISEGCVGVGPG